MADSILTPIQKELFEALAGQQYLQQHFFLSGGTALAEYYLHHRLSEDLDFFSLEEVDSKAIRAIFATIKPKVDFQKITMQTSFNRNLFFLHFSSEIVKTEFTFYPFEQIESPKKKNLIRVESLIDIAVNKADTIITNPATRHFIDLYLILQKEKWTFEDIVRQARIKFDTYIDPLQQAENILKVSQVKDYPHMLIAFDFKDCEMFWMNEAKKLKKEILK